MRNQDKWEPTKYISQNGHLKASRNPSHVAISSRLVCDLIALHLSRGLKEHASGRLLDLGCGNVPLFAFYKDLVSEITCVDWANTVHTNEYLDFECDLTQPLPFPDQRFDTVILSDVLEHIPEPETLLSEIARMLSPSGKVLITVPFFYWLHEEPHDYYRYSEFALKRFIKKSALNLIEITPIGGAPEIVTDIFAKNVVRFPIVGTSLARLSQGLTSGFISTGIGAKVSASTKLNFPLEYFVVAAKP
jgi:SAM-dependent methyltransferase